MNQLDSELAQAMGLLTGDVAVTVTTIVTHRPRGWRALVIRFAVWLIRRAR